MGIMVGKYLSLCYSKRSSSSSKKQYPTVIEELCTQFSLAELRRSTNNFDEDQVISTTRFSTVYRGCLKHEGRIDYTVALKRLKSESILWKFKKEIECLCQLRNPNLVSLIGFCDHRDEKILVFEYMSNGSLYDCLRSKDIEPLSWKKRLEICIGAAKGLHYLHTGTKRPIFHLDIKPQNILLDDNMVPKLSHLGFSLQGPPLKSKPKPIKVDMVIGSFGYLAPEYVVHIVTDKCDVYSFGMVLLQVACTSDNNMIVDKAKMLANQQLGEGGSEYDSGNTFFTIMTFLRQFPIEEIIDPILDGKIASECWQVFIDIMKRCLKYEPDERPTIGEVEVLLEHALSLQEEADIRKTDGSDYTLLSSTMVLDKPSFYTHDQEENSDYTTSSLSFDEQQSDYNLNT